MEIFYLIVGIIALVLAFFLLWISFSSNVRENSWEFGVLRAIGLTHA
jgi:ABC-type antimicrobial peptide transport system permease subunit